jgi:hypothetical protein
MRDWFDRNTATEDTATPAQLLLMLKRLTITNDTASPAQLKHRSKQLTFTRDTPRDAEAVPMLILFHKVVTVTEDVYECETCHGESWYTKAITRDKHTHTKDTAEDCPFGGDPNVCDCRRDSRQVETHVHQEILLYIAEIEEAYRGLLHAVDETKFTGLQLDHRLKIDAVVQSDPTMLAKLTVYNTVCMNFGLHEQM